MISKYVYVNIYIYIYRRIVYTLQESELKTTFQ